MSTSSKWVLLKCAQQSALDVGGLIGRDAKRILDSEGSSLQPEVIWLIDKLLEEINYMRRRGL